MRRRLRMRLDSRAMEDDPRLHADRLAEWLRGVWKQHLGLDVADDTDFFDAGGQSLAATHIIAAIDSSWGIRLPLRLLFDNSRFDAFVQVVVQWRSSSEGR